jgi:hypothetical protein
MIYIEGIQNFRPGLVKLVTELSVDDSNHMFGQISDKGMISRQMFSGLIRDRYLAENSVEPPVKRVNVRRRKTSARP